MKQKRKLFDELMEGVDAMHRPGNPAHLLRAHFRRAPGNRSGVQCLLPATGKLREPAKDGACIQAVGGGDLFD